jgi:hypothetical protein
MKLQHFGRWTKSKRTILHIITYHRQTPSDEVQCSLIDVAMRYVCVLQFATTWKRLLNTSLTSNVVITGLGRLYKQLSGNPISSYRHPRAPLLRTDKSQWCSVLTYCSCDVNVPTPHPFSQAENRELVTGQSVKKKQLKRKREEFPDPG